MPSVRRLTLLLPCLLCACSALVPSEKRVSQSVQATEAIATESERTTRRTMSVVPEMAMRVAQPSNSVGIPLAITETLDESVRVSTGAGSKDKAAGTSAISIPLGVKLTLIAVGLGLLWLVIWLWRRTSPAVDAALGAGDRAIAAAITQVEHALSTSTDASELTKLNAQKALLEKERGKLKGAK